MAYIWKILTKKVLVEMIPVYLRRKVMFFQFLSIHKTLFARVCFLLIYVTWQNFPREKWRHEVAKILRSFVFVLLWNLVSMCKGSQSRIYADLLRFQPRVNDPLHVIILMKNIIPFFNHFFHVLTLNNRIKE